ncbi:MAG: succinate dehydrogenase assembly factor 2 [Gammaproteobacteria bacterium]|nr:succinate dehydrogenase assembly factor 2 [Gammaproteobacteria bacterium]
MSEISRLRWRCRRGMKELDMAMLTYLDTAYEAATDEEKEAFKSLLDYQEPVLYGLISGTVVPEDESINKVIQYIRANLRPIP